MKHKGNKQKKSRYPILKRFLDLVLSALLLLLLALPMLLLSLLIPLDKEGPALFRQVRIGASGEPFVCLKFRTMKRNAPHDLPTALFSDSHRYLTPIGRFLRRSSLDELPQLLNVLRGQMSLIGPRPLIPAETTVHRLRKENHSLLLRPGLTGLAQISGRDLLGDEDKAALDGEYYEKYSLLFDMKIFFSTFAKVFGGTDVRLGQKDEKS